MSSDIRLSPSNIPIAPVYRPDDAIIDYAHDLGDPGQFPYTRGVQPTMYRGRLWTMRQYAGFGTAQQTNARFRLLLELADLAFVFSEASLVLGGHVTTSHCGRALAAHPTPALSASCGTLQA